GRGFQLRRQTQFVKDGLTIALSELGDGAISPVASTACEDDEQEDEPMKMSLDTGFTAVGQLLEAFDEGHG
ncbi:MAG: hypothetical protein ACKO7W_18640, partial [Elainella sp.]